MDDNIFRLDGVDTTQVWVSASGTLPRLLYWGARLQSAMTDADVASLSAALAPALPHGGLDVPELVSWMPEPGRGFTDHPGLSIRRGNALTVTQLVRTDPVETTANAWSCRYADDLAGVLVSLTLSIDAETSVFSAQAELTNTGNSALSIDTMAALTIPLPAQCSERICFGGRWAQEFVARREPVGSGAWVQESRTGRTSHHAWPGVILTAPGTGWAQGEAIAAQLAWSGNHRVMMQALRHGGAQLQLGELLLPGEIDLAPGETYCAPPAHFVRTAHGLRDLALRWHRFIRTRILPQRKLPAVRRVQFNSWEATYFDHDEVSSMALADKAAALGIERYVLDDGWFAGRVNDRAGLGDWHPCPRRYPNGLGPLARHCNTLGMQFGLWIEPEGVNADSDLYRKHPDWVLNIPGRDQPLGRHQYVLDFGRVEVREHMFHAIKQLLDAAPIGYLKWDMNRDMTHAACQDGCAGVRRHVEGVYAVLARLRTAYPQLEIETCASGGARGDLGVLQFADRVWPSDCNDPVERASIHAGFLAWLPATLMGAHVGDRKSHTTGRETPMALRTQIALLGHFGVEANLHLLDAPDHMALARAIAAYKDERTWLADADVTPIDSPHPNMNVTFALASDGTHALISVVATSRVPAQTLPSLRLPIKPDTRRYRLAVHPGWPVDAIIGAKQPCALARGETLALTGELLAYAGVSLPIPQPERGYVLRMERADIKP